MSVEEAAERLDLPPSAVRKLIESGELPAQRFGRLTRIPVMAVEQLKERFCGPKRDDKSTEERP